MKPGDTSAVIAVADKLQGTDAEAVLLELAWGSFCNGSELLEQAGLISVPDGQETEICQMVRKDLRIRREFTHLRASTTNRSN
jgi:hypothetical protein